MFSEVNQTSVNLCARRGKQDAGALAQTVHHGGRGDGPFGALNVAADVAGGPTRDRLRCYRSCSCSAVRAVLGWYGSRVPMAAMALVAGICWCGICNS